MPAFISPPPRIPFPLNLGLWVVRRIAGQDLLPARLLAWYPRAAVSSGVLEALITHADGRLEARLLQLVRLQVSFTVHCAFCVDMNAVGRQRRGISDEEIRALQGLVEVEQVASFTARERLALAYARAISQTPLQFPAPLIDQVRAHFSEREMVILATTAAQVNYWTRLIQALGVPPAGFSELCNVEFPASP